MNTIGERIHTLRKRQHITLEELGNVAGTSKQTIKKYEDGIITNIPSDKIEKIAKALDTTPAYLMGWEDSEEVEEEKRIIRKIKMANLTQEKDAPADISFMIEVWEQLEGEDFARLKSYAQYLVDLKSKKQNEGK